MPGLELAEVILAVIIGTLAAIVYSLRVLILLERRVASMEMNIQRVTSKILLHGRASRKPKGKKTAAATSSVSPKPSKKKPKGKKTSAATSPVSPEPNKKTPSEEEL